MKNKSFHDWRRVLTLALFVLLGSAYTWAQSIQVTGKVIDNLGEPLIGVSIQEKGTTNGIVTDLDGNYTLNVAKGATLVFSYVGYTTQEQTVTSGTLNVTMKEDNELLDEVVVIGYGTVKAKNFTGSVDMVKMSDSPIADLSLTSAADLLRGRLSGVIMGAESGEVGGSSSILIRGKKSINSTSEEPLIILNGVIFTGELNDIDPTTIENISVLKDATSLAAYGSKAAQGVIMVTTKKGKEGKPQISFSTSHQFSTPSYKPKYLSGEQYIVYKNMKNGNVDDLTNTSWMTPFELENYEKGQETDWYDLATRMGYTQNYNASISGAGERFNYYVSVGHSDMKGMLLGNHFARNTMSMNTSSKVASWLELGANMSFTNTINDEVPVGLYGCLMTPYGEPYMPDGSYRKFVDGQDAVMTSPLWTTGAERNNRRSNLNLGGFLSLDIPWVEGLNFRVNASYSRVDLNNKSFYHESYYPTNIAGDWDGIGYTGSNLSLVEANGTIASTQTISWLMDYILSYSRAFGNHYVSASLVYTRDSSEAIAQSNYADWQVLEYTPNKSNTFETYTYDITPYADNFSFGLHLYQEPGTAMRTYRINPSITVKLKGYDTQEYPYSSMKFITFSLAPQHADDPYIHNVSGNGNLKLQGEPGSNSAANIVFQGFSAGVMEQIEQWAFMQPIALNSISPDTGQSIKGVPDDVPSYSYTYDTPGTYTATFLAGTGNYQGESGIQAYEVTFTIVDRLE